MLLATIHRRDLEEGLEVGGLERASSLSSRPRVGLLDVVSSGGETDRGLVWVSQPQRNQTKEKAEPRQLGSH